MSDHTIVPMLDTSDRFVIVDKDGKIVDDAQGWGYKTRDSAAKALWYKLKGGKEKIDSVKLAAQKFWYTNREVAKYLNNLFEMNFKELSRGESTTEELLEEVCKKYSIKEIPSNYVKYLR
jgi:hypothetical protein